MAVAVDQVRGVSPSERVNGRCPGAPTACSRNRRACRQASLDRPPATISRITVESLPGCASDWDISHVPTGSGGTAITRAWFADVLSSGLAGVRARGRSRAAPTACGDSPVTRGRTDYQFIPMIKFIPMLV